MKKAPQLFLAGLALALSFTSVAAAPEAIKVFCLQPYDPRPECQATATDIRGLADIFRPLKAFIASLIANDLDSAITDAKEQVPPDTEAETCWTDLKALAGPSIPEGAGVAYIYQKYRDVKRQAAKITIDCINVAPAIGMQMNIAIAAVGKLLP